MIRFNEEIFKENHPAYHLTTMEHMKQITEEGLLPLCGDHCKRVGHTEKGICFFDFFPSWYRWAKNLYPEVPIKDLEMLRFNLKGRTWHARDYALQDYYVLDPVLKEDIEFLQVTTKDGTLLSLDYNKFDIQGVELNWYPLSAYKVLRKSK